MLYNEGKQKKIPFLTFFLVRADTTTVQGALATSHRLSGMGTRKRNSFKGNQWAKVGRTVRSCTGLLSISRDFLLLPVPRRLPSNLPLRQRNSHLNSAKLEGCVLTVLGERRNSSHGRVKSCLSNSNATHGVGGCFLLLSKVGQALLGLDHRC